MLKRDGKRHTEFIPHQENSETAFAMTLHKSCIYHFIARFSHFLEHNIHHLVYAALTQLLGLAQHSVSGTLTELPKPEHSFNWQS